MKKTWKISLIAGMVLAVWGSTVYAGGNNNQNNSDTVNNYGDTINRGGQGGAGGDANAVGVGIGMGGEGGVGIGVGGTGIGHGGNGIGVGGSADSSSRSHADANANSGAVATGGASGGNSMSVNTDVEARAIPVGSSIAAGANATTKCALHTSKSFNLFFASIASSGHKPDYMCWAQELGHSDVAIQMACNDDDSFRTAFNQVARRNGVEECLDN